MSEPKNSPNVTLLPAPVGDRAVHTLVSEQIETTSSKKLTVDAELENLQHRSFNYFLYETNPANGLVIDKTETNWPSSIAATGLALASYPVGVERGFIPRAAAVERTLTTLRFFWSSPQGPEPDATGYKGFYYHFLDMQTGRRAWQCELSTVDTAFLLAGTLTAATYFTADAPEEAEIRRLTDALYRRADRQWAQEVEQRSRTAGNPKADFSSIAGKATTRRCCSTSWD